MYGAYLQYGGTRAFGSQSNMTLTVGTLERVFCIQSEDTGPLPTSIEWYNPQGQLVSSNRWDDVNQFGGSGRAAILNFASYQQSQGGKYECRVAGPGNKTERLSVCIGECYTFLLTVKPATSDSDISLYLVCTTCTTYSRVC